MLARLYCSSPAATCGKSFLFRYRRQCIVGYLNLASKVHFAMVSGHTQKLPEGGRRVRSSFYLWAGLALVHFIICADIRQSDGNFLPCGLEVFFYSGAHRGIKMDGVALLQKNFSRINVRVNLMNCEAGFGYVFVQRPDDALCALEARQQFGVNIQHPKFRQ